MRKEAGYQVTDRISVSLSGDTAASIISVHAGMISEDTLADSVSLGLGGGVDIEREVEVEGGVVKV
jgi:hypothetical protein